MVRAAPWIYTAVLFIVWEAAVRIFGIPTFFLPPPTAIAVAFVEYWGADLPQFAVSRSRPR